MDLARSEGSSWDPRATFGGDHREAKGSEGVNPKLPYFGKVRTGTTDNCVINVSKDMDRKVSEVGSVAHLGLKGSNCGVQEEAKEGRG